MSSVRHELWRDPETRRVWGLEMLEGEVIGCVGPFPETMSPPALDALAFERNGELMRWLGRRAHESSRRHGVVDGDWLS
jgi:hypothetical protein